MNKLFLVLVLLMLAGCSTSARTHAVHGVSGIEIDCSGLGSGWEKCHKRAARECKGVGYKVITRSDDAKDESPYPFGFNPAGYVTRTMLVMCR
ncbi:hypothetical protein LOY67_08135 [Pseudomonas sp. B21-056]|jgi:hypothetical protein|uniref:hypothetical protein n=1 Tax=Pseudomonas sp. B21-056 TaxID=2895495 RepID=UPI00222F2435|nr:hypothetical protein [Pseudomonas sp. B21-056]UZE25360.1 hypothetical protein LOY67_08135 [Pseudomonas sp. B21-056]